MLLKCDTVARNVIDTYTQRYANVINSNLTILVRVSWTRPYIYIEREREHGTCIYDSYKNAIC